MDFTGSDVFEELLKKNTVKTEEYDLLSDIKTEFFELPVICNAEEFERKI